MDQNEYCSDKYAFIFLCIVIAVFAILSIVSGILLFQKNVSQNDFSDTGSIAGDMISGENLSITDNFAVPEEVPAG